MIIKSLVTFVLQVKSKVKLLLHFFRHYKVYIDQESFYPEKKHKTKKQICIDFVSHILKYGEIDASYFILGIDVYGTKYEEYISYNQYMKRRDKLNLTQPINYVCLLRNKSLFATIGACWHFPVVRDLAVYYQGKLKETNYQTIEELLKGHTHLFVKPVDAKKGENVYAIDYIEDNFQVNGKIALMEDLLTILNNLSYKHELVFQNRIKQHPLVSKLHELSVNTLRVVTINHLHSQNASDVVYVGAELRVGTGDSHTDNISAGGIKIGVKEDGRLHKYGFYKKPYGTKTTYHPDSKIIFEDYKIPFFMESIEFCKAFHAKLKEIHIIGWDIALTQDGPVIIEGNDSCGTDFQVLYGPMKDYYDKYLPEL